MIRLLPDSVYNRIAAGEVIVSPAAAVKELVENAADAGATAVTVEISEGGKELIRVTDNGSGIAESELPLAIAQHATSKIQSFEDVYDLHTLGFRGEALASMAQVSRLTIASRTADSEVGARLVTSGGSDYTVEPAGVPEGTTVRVEDLFYNVPARQKFLKSAAREGAQVTETVRRMILGRPDIAFKYIRNGKTVYNSTGNGSVREAAVSVYGPSYTEQMLDVTYEGTVSTVRGTLGVPACIFRNTQRIDFFINGRYVQSKALQQAFIQSYGESLLHGHYPMGVIHLTMKPDNLDINVHPAKLTVMLYQEEAVLEDIMEAVRGALSGAHGAPFIKTPEVRQSVPAPEEAPIQKPPARVPDFWQTAERGKGSMQNRAVQPASGMEAGAETGSRNPRAGTEIGESVQEDAVEACCLRRPGVREAADIREFTDLINEPETDEQERGAPQDIREAENLRVLGSAFSTYIVCETEGRLFFIDQHAARERLTYEELLDRVRKGERKSQMLLIPIVRTLSAPDFDLFEENAHLLGDLGLSFEPFGELTIRIFGFPVEIGSRNVDSFLSDVAYELRAHPNDPVVMRERLASSACRHSVKAGTELTDGEISALLQEILSMDSIPYCPHGRPIAVELTKTQLEKSFKRKV